MKALHLTGTYRVRTGAHIPDGIPDDLDTTALAYTVLQHEPQSITRVMNEMLKYKTDEGRFLVCLLSDSHCLALTLLAEALLRPCAPTRRPFRQRQHPHLLLPQRPWRRFA